ncbi:hypothetical protein [Natronococcus occultus]|uniref:Uncharacterized protein n=1 Tax=Natronococcus occultus SP4 TaxID=694430 RepID=L0K3Y9_9EURY|nr:hypothetical protein [Natronococcus occultus]AGB39079.1 hypothetical protein Natoc_3346 [Natronococcus occultus SP4]
MENPASGEDDVDRAAAICESCGDAVAVRVEGDGELRPIGSEKGECCACTEPELRPMSDASEILDETESIDRPNGA